jgi:hypothetical protein
MIIKIKLIMRKKQSKNISSTNVVDTKIVIDEKKLI